MLGVQVGAVDKVTPSGTDVVVEMHYDDDIDVPADAKAVIVSPSIVGDRYIQLTPVYESGPKLADGAILAGPGHRAYRWSSTRSTPASTS